MVSMLEIYLVEAGADVEETWSWLHQQDLKKETEGLIIAAQDQALRTNYIKFRIDKTATSPMCRLCHNKNETIDHVLSGCPKLSQAEYKSRHDNVAAAIHWSMCRKYQIECKDKWYEHRAEKVAENDKVKLLWDFHMQTDHVIEARRPDIVLVKKKEATAVIVDIASARRYTDKDERARQDTEVSGPQERDKEAMEPKVRKGCPYRSRGTGSSHAEPAQAPG